MILKNVFALGEWVFQPQAHGQRLAEAPTPHRTEMALLAEAWLSYSLPRGLEFKGSTQSPARTPDSRGWPEPGAAGPVWLVPLAWGRRHTARAPEAQGRGGGGEAGPAGGMWFPGPCDPHMLPRSQTPA